MAVARYGAIRNIRDEDPYRYLGGTPGLLGRRGQGPYRGLIGPRQFQSKANIPRGTTATQELSQDEKDWRKRQGHELGTPISSCLG